MEYCDDNLLPVCNNYLVTIFLKEFDCQISLVYPKIKNKKVGVLSKCVFLLNVMVFSMSSEVSCNVVQQFEAIVRRTR